MVAMVLLLIMVRLLVLSLIHLVSLLTFKGRIIMKIKNNVLKSGVILMMGATLGSCSDFLELEPLNEIVLERFWNEESDIENIVGRR